MESRNLEFWFRLLTAPSVSLTRHDASSLSSCPQRNDATPSEKNYSYKLTPSSRINIQIEKKENHPSVVPSYSDMFLLKNTTCQPM